MSRAKAAALRLLSMKATTAINKIKQLENETHYALSGMTENEVMAVVDMLSSVNYCLEVYAVQPTAQRVREEIRKRSPEIFEG